MRIDCQFNPTDCQINNCKCDENLAHTLTQTIDNFGDEFVTTADGGFDHVNECKVSLLYLICAYELSKYFRLLLQEQAVAKVQAVMVATKMSRAVAANTQPDFHLTVRVARKTAAVQ